jgi:hypothetical protein
MTPPAIEIAHQLAFPQQNISPGVTGQPALVQVWPGETRSVRVGRVGGGENGQLPWRLHPESIDCPGEGELRATKTLHEIAPSNSPSLLEMGEHGVQGAESPGVTLGENCAPGHEAVSIEQEMGPGDVTFGVAGATAGQVGRG